MMSKEFLPTGADFNKKMSIIDDTYDDVGHMLETIAQQQEGHLDDIHQEYAWLTSKVRQHQLRALSLLILEAAESASDNLSFPIDSMHLLDDLEAPSLHYMNIQDEEAQEAIRQGERLGTDDLLAILTPDNITNPSIRDIYFSPWTRNAAKKIIPAEVYSADGVMILSRPTRIPDVEVLYHYHRKARSPERKIRIKGQR